MKIQIIGHATEKDPKIKMRWHWLPLYFVKLGHEIDHVLKQDWKYFYLRYLRFKPDVLIAVGPVAFLPTLLKKVHLIRCPLVYDWTDDNVDINGKEYGLTKMALYEFFAIEYADCITTPSRFNYERCKLWQKDAYYIPHGVGEDFDNTKPIHFDGDKLKVFYGGELSKRKRVDKLVEAVRGKDCELYLFGKLSKDFMVNAPSNVTYMGSVDQEILPRVLKSMDILVLTSDDDSTLKMYEYLRAGRPILGLRGKLNYFLIHLENAYLTDDLSKGLDVLINKPELRTQLVEGVKKVQIDTWEEVTKEYLNVLERINRVEK